MSDSKQKLRLQCPLPKLDFDHINLGHGSGGVLANRLLDQGIFDLFENEQLQKRHDGALLKFPENAAFTTDSFVVSPLFFPGGDIGDLAVNGTVNDLAMCGAIPRYISLGFILEEGLPITDFWEILISIKHACTVAGVEVVTGDTKVVEKGHGDGIFINTTGIGEVHPEADIDHTRIGSDDAIVVSGPLAAHGMTIMSQREGLRVDSAIRTDSCSLNHTIHQLLDAFGKDIHLLRDPTRGGVASTLNEVCHQIAYGIEVHESSFVVDEQVSGLCELFGLDPLYVANEGLFVAFVKKDIAEDFVNTLRTLDHGNQAAIVGQVTTEHPSKVILNSAIGGKRVLQMLPGDQLPRIC